MSFFAFTSALCSTRNSQISRLPPSAAKISGVAFLDDKEKMNETKTKQKMKESQRFRLIAQVREFVILFGFRIDIGFVLDKKFTNTEVPFSRRNVERSESPVQRHGCKR